MLVTHLELLLRPLPCCADDTDSTPVAACVAGCARSLLVPHFLLPFEGLFLLSWPVLPTSRVRLSDRRQRPPAFPSLAATCTTATAVGTNSAASAFNPPTMTPTIALSMQRLPPQRREGARKVSGDQPGCRESSNGYVCDQPRLCVVSCVSSCELLLVVNCVLAGLSFIVRPRFSTNSTFQTNSARRKGFFFL